MVTLPSSMRLRNIVFIMVWKVAFITNEGLYKPTVMFFGLTNSPTTFQTMMNTIFRDLINKGSITIYMDDIAIHMGT